MRLNSFAVASPVLLEAIGPGSKLIVCHDERVLFEQGEEPAGVYVIRKGEAALVMRSDAGDIVMCVQARPGAMIGLPGAIANQPYTLRALARGGSELGFTSSKDLRDLLAANPSLYPSILEILAAEVREMRQAVLESQGSAA